MNIGSWFLSIAAEMECLSTEDILENAPEHPVEKQDRVVGIASEGLRRGFTLMQKRRKRMNDFVETFTYCDGGEQCRCNEKNLEFIQLKNEIKVLGDIFWNFVREEFPQIAEKSTIGIRANWQIVWVEDIHPHLGILQDLAINLLLTRTRLGKHRDS